MMEKRVLFQSQYEECSIEPISFSESTLIKSASYMSQEIKDFVEKNIKSDPRYLYCLVSALGAGEIWGPNVNGDYFAEEDILKSYKTFEVFGYVFTHHQNKDPQNAIGRILLAHWNPRMHRVELLIQIERAKAPQICRDIENGKMWDVSMGCKVKFDVCSICNHHAKTREEYCDHVRHHMGEILPDGRQVYVRNPNPTFFDISFVYIGADRTAKALAKVASALGISEDNLIKKSDIVKEVPGQVISSDAAHMASLLMEELGIAQQYEHRIPNDILDDMAESHSLQDILTSLMTCGILLKPQEFQRIYLRKVKLDPDTFEREGLYITPFIFPKDPIQLPFNPLNGEMQEKVLIRIIPMMEDRSALRPYLLPRMIKIATDPSYPSRPVERKSDIKRLLAIPAIVMAAAVYKRYLDQIPEFHAKGLDRILKKNPWLIPVLTATASGVIWGKRAARENSSLEKTASNLAGRLLVGIPAAYLTAHLVKGLNSDSKIIQFLSKNPLLVAMLGVALTNEAEDWKAIKKALEGLAGSSIDVVKLASPEAIAPPKRAEELWEETVKHFNEKQATVYNGFSIEPAASALAAVVLNQFIRKGVGVSHEDQ